MSIAQARRWRKAPYSTVAVALLACSLAPTAKGTGLVPVSFALLESSVSLHEPVYVNLAVRNGLPEAISLDLGFDRKEGFRFSVTQPDASTVNLQPYSRGGLGLSGLIVIEPGQGFDQQILLNELYQIPKPGDYWIVVKLATPIRTHSGRKLEPTPWGRMMLRVSDRDEKRLADVCERLAKKAIDVDYQAARAAALALRYVHDPVAVPYLDIVLTRGDSGTKGFAIAGLASIGTTDAVNRLTSHLKTEDAQLRSQIQAALAQIRTGVKLEVND